MQTFETIGMPVEEGFFSLDRNWRFTFVNKITLEFLKRKSEELRVSEERIRLLLESHAQTFWETDENGKIISDSPSWRAYTGMSFEEMLGDGWINAVHPDDRASVESKWKDAVTSVKNIDGEFRIKSPDGAWRWTYVSAVPICDGNGNITKWAGMNIDITERKKAEQALKERESHYHTLLVLNDSIRPLADPVEIQYTAARILGEYLGVERALYSSVVIKDGMEYYLSECVYHVPEAPFPEGIYPTEKSGEIARANREGQNIVVCDLETDPRFSEEKRLHCRKFKMGAWICVPLIKNGKYVACFTVHNSTARNWTQDEITLLEETAQLIWSAVERAKSEKELKESEQRALGLVEKLRLLDENKNEFLNILSHELRNPMAAIMMSQSVLESIPPDSEKAKRVWEVEKRQLNQLSSLVDDLLEVTRISTNKIRLRKDWVELNELVNHAVSAFHAEFEEKGVSLEAELSADSIFIEADPVRLTQIIGNLLSNAVKFTRNGDKTLVIVSEDYEKEQVIITVADNGSGIDSELILDLFNPFVQADRTLDRSKGGLGLGLAIVKGLVELHGGSIEVHSKGIGKGSRFTIRLPLESNKPKEQKLNCISESKGSRRLKILVIEDNKDLADMLNEMLKILGHEVVLAYSGIIGIEMANFYHPDLILSDIGLPDLSGYEVAEKIHSIGGLKDTILVAMSGYAQPSDIEKSKEAGFQRHLAKPVILNELKNILDEFG